MFLESVNVAAPLRPLKSPISDNSMSYIQAVTKQHRGRNERMVGTTTQVYTLLNEGERKIRSVISYRFERVCTGVPLALKPGLLILLLP